MSVSLRPSSSPLLASWQGRSRSGRRVKAGTWSAQECPRVSVVVVNPAELNEKKVRPSVRLVLRERGMRPALGQIAALCKLTARKTKQKHKPPGVTPCETEYELVWPFKRRCREKEKNDAELDSSNIRPTWWRKKSRASGSGVWTCWSELWRRAVEAKVSGLELGISGTGRGDLDIPGQRVDFSNSSRPTVWLLL